MRNITSHDQKVARNFRRIWNLKKSELELTQVKAAKQLGITQAAFSQFLNCAVAMNTDMVIKVATLLRVTPEELDPKLATALRVMDKVPKDVPVPVLFSLSGKLSGDSHVTASIMQSNAPHVYAVHVDTSQYENSNIYKDCYLIVAPNSVPRPGSLLLVSMRTGERMLCKYVADDSATLSIQTMDGDVGTTRELPQDDVFSYHRVMSVQY